MPEAYNFECATIQEIYDALDQCTGGESILVTAFALTPFEINGYSFDSEVTLRTDTETKITRVFGGSYVQAPNGSALMYVAYCNNLKVAGFDVYDPNAAYGLKFYESTNVTAEDNICHETQLIPLQFINCNHALADGNEVFLAGGALLQFGFDLAGTTGPYRGWTARNNIIYDSGTSGNDFAEGLYAGQGAPEYAGLGPIYDVLFEDNIILRTKAEAIDLKEQVVNPIVRRNQIIDCDIAFDSAIVYGFAQYVGQDSICEIYENIISNLRCRNNYSYYHINVSHGDAYVYDNQFIDVPDTPQVGGFRFHNFAFNKNTNKVYVGNHDLSQVTPHRRYLIGRGENEMDVIFQPTGKRLFWLDASDPMTIITENDGVTVSEWRDKSENAFHAVQTSTGNKPKVSDINGTPAISFNGVNQFLQLARGPVFHHDTMILMVVFPVAETGTNYLYSFQQWGHPRSSLANKDNKWQWTLDHDGTSITRPEQFAAQPQIVWATVDGRQRIQNFMGQTKDNANPPFSVTEWFIGSQNTTQNHFQGTIGEMVIYEYLDQTTFDTEYARLKQKWNISDVNEDAISVVNESSASIEPTIARRSHGPDVFVQPGETLSLTYDASEICTLTPKLYFEDAEIQHTHDGKSITLTWQVPVDEPSRSFHLGVKGEYLGDNHAFCFDRVHVGKYPSDLVWLDGRTVTDATNALGSGQTLIIPNDTYTGDANRLLIGLIDGVMHCPNTGNGLHTFEEFSETYNGVTYTSQRAKVSKFTSIMAETPFEVILDGEHVRSMSRLVGNRGFDRNAGNPWETRQQVAGRSTIGIEVTGISFVDNIYGSAVCENTQQCSYFNIGVMQSTTFADNPAWNGGGGYNMGHRQSHDSKFERFYCIGNTRMMLNTGQRKGGQPREDALANGGIRHMLNAYETGFTKGLITPACVQHDRNDDISYGLESYGAFKLNVHNVLSIDNIYYNAGISKLNNPGVPETYQTFSTFGTVNSEGDLHDWWGIGALNTGRSLLILDGSGFTSKQADKLNNFLCWKFISRPEGSAAPMVTAAESINIGRGLVGHTSGYAPDEPGQAFDMSFFNTYFLSQESRVDGVLFASQCWDYDFQNQDTVFHHKSPYLSIGKLAFIDMPPSTLPSILSAASAVYQYTPTQAVDVGCKYITRLEQNSELSGLKVGNDYYFRTKGRYLKYPTDPESQITYDVNWLSRSLWEKYQELSRQYVLTSNGIEFDGNQGWAVSGMHPVDYANREGTTVNAPVNTPYLDDIYGVTSQGQVTLLWRPICSAYRSTVTGYDIYMDGELVIADLAATTTKVTLNNIPAGLRTFNVVVKDSVTGDSGYSRDVRLYHDIALLSLSSTTFRDGNTIAINSVEPITVTEPLISIQGLSTVPVVTDSTFTFNRGNLPNGEAVFTFKVEGTPYSYPVTISPAVGFSYINVANADTSERSLLFNVAPAILADAMQFEFANSSNGYDASISSKGIPSIEAGTGQDIFQARFWSKANGYWQDLFNVTFRDASAIGDNKVEPMLITVGMQEVFPIIRGGSMESVNAPSIDIVDHYNSKEITSYVGRNNTAEFILLESNEPIDLNQVSEIEIIVNNKVFSEKEGVIKRGDDLGLIELNIHALDLPFGSFEYYFVLYTTTQTKGIVWNDKSEYLLHMRLN